MYLLDTNTVIYYLNASLPPSSMQFLHKVMDEHCNISVITRIEVLGYNFSSSDQQKLLEDFVSGAIVLNLDEEIVSRTIEIRKGKKIKLPDAIIAATAIVYNLSLVSRNILDFSNINGLKIIDPWKI